MKLFYENIIKAVVENNKNSVIKILEAFELSKAPENQFVIINAFETAIAIEFLDKGTLSELIDSPAHDINMVSVDEWPEYLTNLPCLEGRLSYDQNSRQVIYIGKMDADTKSRLLEEIEKNTENKEHLSVAVEHLFNQSKQKPFIEQVL